MDSKVISDKLANRRNALTKAGMTYYRFISREVNVVGSNQKEYFKVSNHGEGLQVRVYGRENGNDTSFLMYDRIFEPSNTREIRLYGLGDDDVFDIDENAKSRIKMRIIGGRGNDTFNIRGNVKNLIYDMNVEGNYIQHTSHTKNRFSKDPPVNSYSILGYKYNTSEFPRILIGANSDDGFILGAGFAKRTYGFRNEPYATDQKFGLFHSFNTGSYRFRYDGEFNHITHNIDLLLKGRVGVPEVNNFFGLGNTTEISDEKNYDFYKTQFKLTELQVLFRQRVFERLQLIAGPYYLHYSNKYSQNADQILGDPSSIHLDSNQVYTTKNYLGAKLAMNFDNTNNGVFPTRGVHWENEFVATAGLTETSKTFTKISSDMTIYASLSDPAKLIGVVSFGGSKIFNKTFEFFQATAIGNNNLHGFRANRYLGKSTLYASTELRYRLFNLKSYIIPGPVGLTGFYDIGRVWLDGEDSKRWHSAYGGGLYFVPYNKFMISGSVGFSGKENMFTFVLGTKINLSY